MHLQLQTSKCLRTEKLFIYLLISSEKYQTLITEHKAISPPCLYARLLSLLRKWQYLCNVYKKEHI